MSIIYEDALVMVIMSPSQANPGHVLIVPKQHIGRFAEMSEETGMHLFRIAQRSRRAIEESGIRCEGAYLALAEGDVSFQGPHVYMDLVPRFRGDRYYTLAVIDRPYSDPEALERLLAEHRARRWRRELPREQWDQLSPEAFETLAASIRDSYEAIWGKPELTPPTREEER